MHNFGSAAPALVRTLIQPHGTALTAARCTLCPCGVSACRRVRKQTICLDYRSAVPAAADPQGHVRQVPTVNQVEHPYNALRTPTLRRLQRSSRRLLPALVAPYRFEGTARHFFHTSG